MSSGIFAIGAAQIGSALGVSTATGSRGDSEERSPLAMETHDHSSHASLTSYSADQDGAGQERRNFRRILSAKEAVGKLIV